MPSMFAEPDLATFQRLRCAFDPDGLANPGKVMPTPRLCGEVPGPVPPASARASRDRGADVSWRPETVTREAPGLPRRGGAALLRRCSDEGLRVCPVGGAARSSAGAALGEPVDVELSTAGVADVVEHNEGDLTAVLDAGAPLAAAQAAFAEAGQMLALDPPLGAGGAATIGGVVASGDSGPLRHRYGAARDLVVGMTMALADGTVARAGGKVIKNVAGYDLAKLLAGSFGTLGLILGSRSACTRSRARG